MKRSYSLRLLIGLVLVAAVVFAILHYQDPVNRYRRTRSEAAFVSLFGTKIHDGMTRDEVSQLLGCESETVPDRYIQTIESVAPRNLVSFPYSAEPDDEYEWWPCVKADGGPTQYIFQYRDEKLINFDAQLSFRKESLSSLSN